MSPIDFLPNEVRTYAELWTQKYLMKASFSRAGASLASSVAPGAVGGRIEEDISNPGMSWTSPPPCTSTVQCRCYSRKFVPSFSSLLPCSKQHTYTSRPLTYEVLLSDPPFPRHAYDRLCRYQGTLWRERCFTYNTIPGKSMPHELKRERM